MKPSDQIIIEAAEKLGITTSLLPAIENVPEDLKKIAVRSQAHFLLDIAVEKANNEGQPEPWLPDYSNYDQPKYELWHDYNGESGSAASGWSLLDVDSWFTRTTAGARRNFRSRKIAEKFYSDWSELINITLEY